MRFMLQFRVLYGATVKIVAYIRERMAARHGIIFYTSMKRPDVLKCLSILRIRTSSMLLPGSSEGNLMRFLQAEKGVPYIKVLMAVRPGRSYLMVCLQQILAELH